MTHHHTAQGLASLGRHGDTMLVHMSPHEVAGLNYLAKKQGTKLTINPDTGLPEAFSLGGFFSSLLPTIAGMAFAPETGGFSMAPLLAGAATGAGLAAIKGENPLFGGLMGGLGGYGGGNLGYSLGKAAGVNAPVQGLEGTLAKIGGEGASDAIGTNVLQQTPIYQGGLRMVAPSSLPEINAQQIINAAGQGAGSASSGASAFNPMEKLSQAFSGTKNIAGMGDMAQADAWKAFTGAGGTPTQLAMPVGGALLGGLEPSDLYGNPAKPSDKDKYDPYSTLKLSNDTGLRLVAEGGYIDSKDYAMGGTVTTGGLRDLYATTDSPANPQLSRDGYGVGRLENLARQQALTQAQTMGYADGGDVAASDAAPGSEASARDAYMSDIQRSLMGSSPVHYTGATAGPAFASSLPYGSDMIGEMMRVSPDVFRYSGYGVGRGTSPEAYAAFTAPSFRRSYAMGGPVSFADGGDAMKLNDEIAPVDQGMGLANLSATTPTAPGQAMPSSQVQNMASALSGPTSSNDSIVTKVANDLRADPNYKPTNPIEAAIAKQIKGTDTTQQPQQAMGLGSIAPSQPMAPSYNPSVAMGPTYYAGMNAPRGFADGGDVAAGDLSAESAADLAAFQMAQANNPSGLYGINSGGYGITAPTRAMTTPSYTPSIEMQRAMAMRDAERERLAAYIAPSFRRGMAKGGYLDGAGDGMSDSIPATIEGQQPARLADGEFVVPADVVSHIGNGSSKAGSKRLYAMLDRVRKARTGHTKQGKEINPNKYMPA